MENSIEETSLLDFIRAEEVKGKHDKNYMGCASSVTVMGNRQEGTPTRPDQSDPAVGRANHHTKEAPREPRVGNELLFLCQDSFWVF